MEFVNRLNSAGADEEKSAIWSMFGGAYITMAEMRQQRASTHSRRGRDKQVQPANVVKPPVPTNFSDSIDQHQTDEYKVWEKTMKIRSRSVSNLRGNSSRQRAPNAAHSKCLGHELALE